MWCPGEQLPGTFQSGGDVRTCDIESLINEFPGALESC